MKKLLYVFFISMVPFIELRGGIIAGAGAGIPWWQNMLVCIIGSMLPVPFILLFIRKIIEWMKKIPRLEKIAHYLEAKAEKNKAKVLRYAFWGLMLFVAIPLPGTGAWTGSLVAAMLDMRMKKALPAIFVGVAVAAVIMTVASYGTAGIFRIFL